MSTELAKIEPMPVAPSVEAMITLAIERGATVETIERLMAVRREVRAEQAKEGFDRALAAFQAECPTIRKTSKVMNKDGRNVRYQYAPLDAIIFQVKELLQKHGFSYTVNAQALAGSVKAVCKLTHAYGHSESSEFEVPIDKDAYMNPAQQVASALTFAKRYAFCNAAGIMTGDADDDSQGAFKDDTQKRDKPSAPFATPSNVPKRTSVTPATPSTAKPAGSASPSATPAQATEKTRTWFLALLKPLGEAATLYGWEKGWMEPPSGDNDPGEPLELMRLEHVPTTKAEATAILGEIQARMDAGASGPPSSSAPLVENALKGNVVTNKASSDHRQKEWYNFPVPFGKHAGTTLGNLDKNVLFGFWTQFEVEHEYNGRPKKPETIERDQQFRDFLDEAGEHYQFKSND